MSTLFNDEEHLKRHIERLKSNQRTCEYYIKQNRNRMLQLNSELCFICDNYDKLY